MIEVDKKDLKEIAPGIFQKNAKTFYIECKVSGGLCYCSKDRLDILGKKFGGINQIAANYISRDAKRLLKSKVPGKSIAKMGVSDLKAEAKMIKVDKEAKREERRKKRAIKQMVKQAVRIPPLSPTDRHVFTEVYKGDEACIRPRLFIANRGYCNGCGWIGICKYADMKVKETLEEPERIDALKRITGRVDILTDNDERGALPPDLSTLPSESDVEPEEPLGEQESSPNEGDAAPEADEPSVPDSEVVEEKGESMAAQMKKAMKKGKRKAK